MQNLNKIAVDFRSLESVASPALAGQTIGGVVSKFVDLILPIAGFALLFYSIWSGYQYMTSVGDPKTLQTAKNNLTYSIIGFIVVVSAYSIAKLSGTILKLPGLQALFP